MANAFYVHMNFECKLVYGSALFFCGTVLPFQIRQNRTIRDRAQQDGGRCEGHDPVGPVVHNALPVPAPDPLQWVSQAGGGLGT